MLVFMKRVSLKYNNIFKQFLVYKHAVVRDVSMDILHHQLEIVCPS